MLTNRHISSILIILGILIIILTFATKEKEDFYIDELTAQQGGNCILESGYCLHSDRNWTGYIISWIIGGILTFFGLYLILFDKSMFIFQQQQKQFVKEVRAAKKKDTFSAYLAGFSADEQKVLKAIHNQEGIQQATLRFRVGMSKTSLSLLLQTLEEKDVIVRKQKGKTKLLYLHQKF